MVFFVDSAYRTNSDTLTTGYTAGFTQAHFECGTDEGLETTFVSADYADTLYFFADSCTSTAKDTFVVIANHMSCTGVQFIFDLCAIIVGFIINAQFFSQSLKFTVVAAYA